MHHLRHLCHNAEQQRSFESPPAACYSQGAASGQIARDEALDACVLGRNSTERSSIVYDASNREWAELGMVRGRQCNLCAASSRRPAHGSGNCPRGGFSAATCLAPYALWLPPSPAKLVDACRPLWRIWEMTGVSICTLVLALLVQKYKY